jgi:hypothetical protein
MSPYLEDGVVGDMVNPRTPEPRSFLNKRDLVKRMQVFNSYSLKESIALW